MSTYLKDFRIHQFGKFQYFVVDHDFDCCNNFFDKGHLAEPVEIVENHCFDFDYYNFFQSLLSFEGAPAALKGFSVDDV